MAGTRQEDHRDIEWGEDECRICNDSTWLSLVIYEPIDVTTGETGEGQVHISSHPAPQDEQPIAVCSECLTKVQEVLSDANGKGTDGVSFSLVRRYLIYKVYPEYVEKLHPNDAERFAKLSD